jgi:hypothetical protein
MGRAYAPGRHRALLQEQEASHGKGPSMAGDTVGVTQALLAIRVHFLVGF